MLTSPSACSTVTTVPSSVDAVTLFTVPSDTASTFAPEAAAKSTPLCVRHWLSVDEYTRLSSAAPCPIVYSASGIPNVTSGTSTSMDGSGSGSTTAGVSGRVNTSVSVMAAATSSSAVPKMIGYM